MTKNKGSEKMDREEKITRAVFGTISEISRMEKEKALKNNNYKGAIAACIFEGIFKQ
jgi:hypothetical protein